VSGGLGGLLKNFAGAWHEVESLAKCPEIVFPASRVQMQHELISIQQVMSLTSQKTK